MFEKVLMNYRQVTGSRSNKKGNAAKTMEYIPQGVEFESGHQCVGFCEIRSKWRDEVLFVSTASNMAEEIK